MSRKKTSNSIDTTPIINCLSPDHGSRYLDLITELHGALYNAGIKPVEGHKKVFGKQDYCYTGFYRYWVWHSQDDFYRVFIANGKGCSFEVNVENIDDKDEIIRRYEEYVNAIKTALL